MKVSKKSVALFAAIVLSATPLVGCTGSSDTDGTISHVADPPTSPPPGGDSSAHVQPASKSQATIAQGAVPLSSDVTAGNADYSVEQYLTWAITDLDQMWSKWFIDSGYAEPYASYNIVNPGESYLSACDLTVTDTTPNAYYCPSDNDGNGEIWLPATTFQKMWLGNVFERSSTHSGDFAAAIMTAHEFGHHVTDELEQQTAAAIAPQGLEVAPITGKNNELIADCYAGVWASHAYYSNQQEVGDFEEAVAAMFAIGDATDDGTDPHGTSAERVAALQAGYNDQIDPSVCVSNYWK